MPQQTAVNSLVQLFPLALIFIVFYFLLIRPQKQKEKQHQKMLEGVSKNDEVVTSSGIHGTIIAVKEKTATLRIDDNVKMEIEKNSIAYIKKPQNA